MATAMLNRPTHFSPRPRAGLWLALLCVASLLPGCAEVAPGPMGDAPASGQPSTVVMTNADGSTTTTTYDPATGVTTTVVTDPTGMQTTSVAGGPPAMMTAGAAGVAGA